MDIFEALEPGALAIFTIRLITTRTKHFRTAHVICISHHCKLLTTVTLNVILFNF